MAEKFSPSPARIAAARRLYDAGVALKDIAISLKTTPATLKKHMPGWNWPPRTPAGKAGLPDAPATDSDPQYSRHRPPRDDADGGGETTRSLARRVENAVRTELAAVEKRLTTSTAATAERNARILASLVKSLAELRKLDRDEAEARKTMTGRNGDGEGDEEPPVDLNRLRDELADNLARIRASGADETGGGTA